MCVCTQVSETPVVCTSTETETEKILHFVHVKRKKIFFLLQYVVQVPGYLCTKWKFNYI